MIIRDHEPHWLLNAVLVVGDTSDGGMNLVQTVAVMVAPVMAADGRLALQRIQAAELAVRNVLSHSLIERSTLSDEQVADAVARAITLD